MNFEQIAVILSAITGLSEPENSKPASSIHSNTNRVNGHDMLDQRLKKLGTVFKLRLHYKHGIHRWAGLHAQNCLPE